MKSSFDASENDSAIGYRSESDIAVLNYIESLLLDSVPESVLPDLPTDAQPTSKAYLDQSLVPNVLPESLASSGQRPASHSQVPENLPDAANSVADISIANPHSTESSTASNAFLRQLEAAQRKGLGRASAKVDTDVDVSTDEASAVANATRVDNRPIWGRDSFNCLSFKVAGLTLAIPVQFVEGMQPLDLYKPVRDSVEPVDKSNSLVQMTLGKMSVNRLDQAAELCDVIDTARLVMPERYDIVMTESYRYILSLKNCDWCVAVDSIGGELALNSQNVRWRSEHTRREWLAGTVVDKMCALIDVDVLNRQIMADRVLVGTD